MRPEIRDRVLLPILLPIAIIVVIGGVLFGFSRILLDITHTGATAVAFVVAAGIVIAAAVAAARPLVRGSTVGAMAGAVAGIAMLSGGLALAVLSGGEHGGEGEPGGGEGAVVALVARNIAFEPAQLTVPAGEPFTIAFANEDGGTQHNVEIFESEDFSGTPLFQGELVTGVVEVDYEVPALEPATYSFLCVVHPTMTGTIEAVEGGGEGGGPGGGVTVSAQSLAFDTDVIDLAPDAPTTITFDNQEAGVPHNIAIYADESLGESLFQGEIITGPDTVDYEVPALAAGEYYFHCDVHPNMNGAVVVGGPGGGGEEPGGGGGGGEPPEGASGETAAGATGPAPGGGGAAEPSTVVAQAVAFDTDAISLPAGSEATLTFDNQDAGVPHNIAIYRDESLGENLFSGEIVTGPETVDYAIPALEAGEYYFHCDVHPNMRGTVTVA